MNRNLYNMNFNTNQSGANMAYSNYPNYSPVANQGHIIYNVYSNISDNNASVNKKTVPSDIDMLFDSHFMNEGNPTYLQNDTQENNQNKKNHFDFVKDMLKPNKFR